MPGEYAQYALQEKHHPIPVSTFSSCDKALPNDCNISLNHNLSPPSIVLVEPQLVRFEVVPGRAFPQFSGCPPRLAGRLMSDRLILRFVVVVHPPTGKQFQSPTNQRAGVDPRRSGSSRPVPRRRRRRRASPGVPVPVGVCARVL